MKKVLILLLVFCSIFLISCNKETDKIFNIALPTTRKIEKIGSYLTFSNLTVFNATKTELYIQDSDNIHYSLGMAKSMPVDVTSEYVGEEWGIEEGEVGRAWKVELRDDLCWENGDKITAQDFIDSMVIRMICPFDVIKGNSYKKSEIEGGYIDISDVGIRAIDNSLILIYSYAQPTGILCKSLSENTFSLVHEKMYDECFERDVYGNIIEDKYGIKENNYGTSPDKYLSYGPYKLVQLDEEGVRLVRNDNWFGYKDLSEEYYQTDEIVIEYLEDYSTSYDLFTKGKYDYIELNDYLNASYENSINDIDKKYICNVSTNLKRILLINSDYEKLLKREENKENSNFTILSIPEFREALIYCLNLSTLNDLLQENVNSKANEYTEYYLHPFYTNSNEINNYTKEFFHDTEEFQKILDEYYNEILGKTNGIEKADELFTEAYNIALEKGYLTEDNIIYIDFLVGYDRIGEGKVIAEEWEKAISKTVMADKIKFITHDYEVPEQTECTVLWFSSAIIENYNIASIIKYSEMMHFSEYWNKKMAINFDALVDINGVEYNNITLEATIGDWINGFDGLAINTNIISGKNDAKEISLLYKDNVGVTNKIMAECEKFILSDYCIIPTIDEYISLVVSDNVVLNYNYDLHNKSLDFRFITYK